jgi:hypothetical protein
MRSLALVLAGLIGGCTGLRDPAPPPQGLCGQFIVDKPCRVRYEVLGTGIADISYVAEGEAPDLEDELLPWSYEFENEHSVLTLLALEPTNPDKFTCRIYVNNQRVDSVEGDGICSATAIVIAHGSQ